MREQFNVLLFQDVTVANMSLRNAKTMQLCVWTLVSEDEYLVIFEPWLNFRVVNYDVAESALLSS